MLGYQIIRTKHNGYEAPDFKLERPGGTDEYLFLHFKTPVVFILHGHTHRVYPEECILLTPGTPHSFYPDHCELIHNWMHFMPSDRAAFEAIGLPLNTFFLPSDTGFITTHIQACELELIYRREQYEDLLSAHATELMIQLRRRLHEPVQSPHTDALMKLRLDIYCHPDRYGTTVDMAGIVGLSRSRFAVVYKEQFNVAPKNDLIRARISKASHLLSLGTLSLTEISDICGYQSIYHFIRQFRIVTGTTPGKYCNFHRNSMSCSATANRQQISTVPPID